jgi:hypothetical protein
MTVIVLLLVLSALYWIFFDVLVLGAQRTPRLGELDPPAPARWPALSLIVPACNEADTLGPAMASRLAEDYPDLEMVLVNDRSSDDTGVIAEAAAARDPRVRVLHIDRLPEGWLGKIHALERGTQLARGEWLLFTDADVHLQPGTLRRAIAHAEARGIDHLAVVPQFHRGDFALELALASFCRLISLGLRPRAIEDPQNRAALGVGAFNLVRRAALERSPGLAYLKMEVIDDIALGQMLKRAGARASVALGDGVVSLDYYRSAGELIRGMEKNGFAGFGSFNYVQLFAMVVGFAVIECAPLGALAAVGHPLVQLGGLVVLGLALDHCARAARLYARPLGPALLYPFGLALLLAGAVRSAWLAARNGGVAWRGTVYPLAQLRAGMRRSFL